MKNWSNLAQVVYKRTYARKDGGTLENWSDTVARVIAGNVKDKGVSLAEIDRLNYFMMERKAIPAGRGLWYSGSPSHYKIGGAALNNCFAGEETFLTKEHGSVSFIETLNEVVTVWTKEGWRSAEIKEFGMQKIQNIIFAPTDSDGKKFRSNLRLTKTATPDHGWFLKDGTKTTNLKVGDVVASSKIVVDKDENFVEGLRHGLIFGDGAIANIRSDGSFKFQLRMCDSRTVAFKHLFKDVTYPESYGGDCVGRFDSTENLKQFPKDKTPSYIAGFLEGWIQADGNFSKKTTRLSSQNVDAKEWLIANAPLAGYILTGYSSNNLETNYGARKNPLYTYTLSQDEVLWKVESIVELDEEVPVYCAVVEDIHAFTLTGGIYTSNCWFLSGDEIENFVLAMDLLMLGGGVGLSVEHRFTSKLPKVKKDVKVVHTPTKDADFIVPDSREGWGELFRRTLDAFFVTGKSFSYSTVCVRGYGEKIEGFGGTASGPQPLVKFIDTVSSILTQREGRHIRPIDAMDVICCTGEMVVAGNVRRSAIIILGDAFDKEYLKSKRWDLGQVPTYRAFANLSVVLDDIEDAHPLFWKTYENGESFGIVNRKNIQMYARMGDKKKDTAIGVNPCAEATLESGEPCNLQEIALANIKDENEFVEAAVLMHRYGKRVTMENYHHQKITNVIHKNRRIGTGITGCLESPLFNPESLDRAYKAIQQENLKYSKELGIPESIRTTVVKPSGTVSKLLDQKGEGIHAAYSEHMIQRVRFGANDPLIPLLKAAGHYMEPVVRFDGTFDHNTLVVDFYLKAPNGMPCADKDFDTWKQLDVLMMAQKYWADQAVSVTVYYKREELPQIKEWLSNNLKYLKTISFLCHSEHGFKQAPKEAMSKEEYEKRSSKIKELVFDDNQSTNVELADLGLECAGGVCPIR